MLAACIKDHATPFGVLEMLNPRVFHGIDALVIRDSLSPLTQWTEHTLPSPSKQLLHGPAPQAPAHDYEQRPELNLLPESIASNLFPCFCFLLLARHRQGAPAPAEHAQARSVEFFGRCIPRPAWTSMPTKRENPFSTSIRLHLEMSGRHAPRTSSDLEKRARLFSEKIWQPADPQDAPPWMTFAEHSRPSTPEALTPWKAEKSVAVLYVHRPNLHGSRSGPTRVSATPRLAIRPHAAQPPSLHGSRTAVTRS